MKILKNKDTYSMVKTEILELSFDNQEEFLKESERLNKDGWERDIYNHEYDFSTGKHTYVCFIKTTEKTISKDKFDKN